LRRKRALRPISESRAVHAPLAAPLLPVRTQKPVVRDEGSHPRNDSAVRESAMLSQQQEAGSSLSRHDPHIEESDPWPPRQEDSSSIARRDAQGEPSLPAEESSERTPELRPLFLMNKREASALNMGRDSVELVGVSPGDGM